MEQDNPCSKFVSMDGNENIDVCAVCQYHRLDHKASKRNEVELMELTKSELDSLAYGLPRLIALLEKQEEAKRDGGYYLAALILNQTRGDLKSVIAKVSQQIDENLRGN